MGENKLFSRESLLRYKTGFVSAGAVAGASIFYCKSALLGTEPDAMGIGITALLGGAMVRTMISLGSYYKRPVRDIMRILPTVTEIPKPKNSEDIQKHRQKLEDTRDILFEPSYLISMSELDFLEGKIESALDRYEEAIASGPNIFDRGIFHRTISIIAEKLDRLQHSGEDPYTSSMKYAMRYQYEGMFDRAIKHWQKSVEEKDDIDTNILYGRSLEVMGKEELAAEQWHKVMHLVQKEAAKGKSISSERIGQTDVYKLKESDILESVFAFKVRQDRQELEDEFLLTQQTHTSVTSWLKENDLHERYAVARALRMASNSAHSMISLYEKGKPLTDHLKETKDLKKLEEAARFLAIIHSVMHEHALPERDEEEHFVRRIGLLEKKLVAEGRDSAEYSDTLRMLLDSYVLPAAEIKKSQYVFNRDANGINWSISPKERITALDFQPHLSVSIESELSKMLETGRCLPNTPAADLEREKIIAAYREQAISMGIVYPTVLEEKVFRKMNADLIRAASFFCFSYGGAGIAAKGLRREYLQNAIHSAHRLHDEYVDVMDPADLKQYVLFQRGLEGLLALEESGVSINPSFQN